MKQPFEQVVAEHGAVVLRVCRATLTVADADDAWSETFLAALRAWPDLPGDANVRAWLVTIAHRKAIDIHRATSRRAVPVEDLSRLDADRRDHGRGHGSAASPEDLLPDDELWQAIAVLPPKQRQCVAYHHVAGLPHAEVALIVGGTESAARRSAADGIATLRRTYLSREDVRSHV